MADTQEIRCQKAALLFSSVPSIVTINNEVSGTTMKEDLHKLGFLLHKELRVGWDHVTLNTYLEKCMIPCGLR